MNNEDKAKEDPKSSEEKKVWIKSLGLPLERRAFYLRNGADPKIVDFLSQERMVLVTEQVYRILNPEK